MKRPPPSAPRASLSGAAIVLVLKLLWVAFVITTPLLGAWVSSSIAAYQGGPTALAAAIGLLLFPALPLAWDAWSERRRRRRLAGAVKPRVLTFWDRFILRTLAVNLLFLGVLLGTHPETGFTALSTRGDWMLDGRRGERPDAARRLLFRAADRLEWLYVAVRDNPFRDPKKDATPTPTGTGSAGAAAPTASTPAPLPLPVPTAKPASTAEPAPAPAIAQEPGRDARGWPVKPVIHPIVAQMPRDAEQSLPSVARYIADRETDPHRRFKAVHDWVVDRIAYDAVALASGNFPPQDAESVFRSQKGVCAGYAKLLTALGGMVGLEVIYVVGDARTKGQRERGESHAWNAVKLGDRYHLVDATWNSGSVEGTTFTKGYRTDYLLTPPEVFGLDHFPDDPRWQLRDKPISRGDFMRQPMMSPAFYAEGRELVAPDRSQVSVRGSLDVEIKNPRGLFTLASFVAEGQSERTRCKVDPGPITRARCDFPRPGSYFVLLFSNAEQYGTYHYIGQVEVNSGS